MGSSRLQDDPVIQNIAKGIESIQEEQKGFHEKIDDCLFNPEKGLFVRVNKIEEWRDQTIDPERKAVKKWVGKIVWAVVFALIAGGGILGFRITFGN